MAITEILSQIDAEIALLQQARELLARTGQTAHKAAGHSAKKVAGKARKKRVLSADARKRIGDAQRRRWAAQKAKAKSK
ncbi:MAG: hypothetical protein WBD67_14090 [Terracidiphilus sp.]